MRRGHAELLVRSGIARWEGDRIIMLSGPDPTRPFVLEEKPEQKRRVIRSGVRAYRPNQISPQEAFIHRPGVYILKASNGLCKIGQATSMYRRIVGLWTMIPDDFEVLALYPSESHAFEECALHNKFAARRVKGEWFALNEKELAELIEWYPFLLINEMASEFLQKHSSR
jgi:hypothetical protein